LCPLGMDHRLIQPASRDQIVAIIRQRAERANRDLPAHLRQELLAAPAFIDFPGREARPGREGDRPPVYRQAAAVPAEEEMKPRTERVAVAGNRVIYQGDRGLPGLYIASQALTPDRPYFEAELTEGEVGGGVVVGLCSHRYPLDLLPGWTAESVGYHTGDGKLYKGRPRGCPFGPRCQVGDRVGCGVKFDAAAKNSGLAAGMVPVFFTRNGKELGTQLIPCPPGGLFPALGLQRAPEEVRVSLGLRWAPEEKYEDIAMSVDCGEEEWRRLHDIRLNGHVLEYVGRGKSLIDVGLAQAKTALCTRSHYFEIEIVDPGSSCYIAIGLARKDYPRNRHPGWNKGSIAYHADDGKVFMGSGVGDPFGPRCNKGDVMGCGVLFPRDFECRSDSEEEAELVAAAEGGGGGQQVGPVVVRLVENEVEEYETDSGEEEDWWHPEVKQGEKVQVFFTRNGKIIGKKEVMLPKGGFYPTVGMMSSQEKVRVELRPLSG